MERTDLKSFPKFFNFSLLFHPFPPDSNFQDRFIMLNVRRVISQLYNFTTEWREGYGVSTTSTENGEAIIPKEKKWGNVEKFGSAVEWLIHMLKVWEGKVVEYAVGKDRQGGEWEDNGGKVKSICCLVWSSDGTLESESESWRKDIWSAPDFCGKMPAEFCFPKSYQIIHKTFQNKKFRQN